jgi:AcrR family transcriptional regulator
MGRRSDHSRPELQSLIIAEGHKHMADVGFPRFSAREVAKRIGYSIGTLYNVFGTYDRLIYAINTRTFRLWTEQIERRLADAAEDRIKALVEGYFRFAAENRNLWMAIYDHRVPPDFVPSDEETATRAQLTRIAVEEVAALLPESKRAEAPRLASSLIATVHGHCMFALNGTFEAMGEDAPITMALDRVRESIAACTESDSSSLAEERWQRSAAEAARHR